MRDATEARLSEAWDEQDCRHKVGTGSLENKQTFIMPCHDGDIGRGGGGVSNFVFAILDWTSR